MTEFAKQAGPWAGGWLLWAVVLHLLFLAMQFGAVTGSGSMRALWSRIANFLPFAGVSLAMWGIGALLSMTIASVSMLWAGLLALVLHQGYQLLRTIMKVWTVAAQYDAWQSKQILGPCLRPLPDYEKGLKTHRHIRNTMNLRYAPSVRGGAF